MIKYPQVLHVIDKKYGSSYKLLEDSFDMYNECLKLIKNNLNNGYYVDVLDYINYSEFEDFIEKTYNVSSHEYHMIPARYKKYLKSYVTFDEESRNKFNDLNKSAELLLMLNDVDTSNDDWSDNQDIKKAIKRIINYLHVSSESQCQIIIEIFDNVYYGENSDE